MGSARKPRSASRGRLPSEEMFDRIYPDWTERRVTRSATAATKKTVTAPNGGHGTCLNWATVAGCVILGMTSFFILERIPYEALYEFFFEALQSFRILPRVRCPQWPECQKCVDSCVAPS